MLKYLKLKYRDGPNMSLDTLKLSSILISSRPSIGVPACCPSLVVRDLQIKTQTLYLYNKLNKLK